MSSTVVDLDSRWDTYIDGRWLERLDGNPFMTRCREGRATRAELYRFVRQQFHYARHFTRYFCALLANVIDERDRFELTHNLFEEMGLGDLGAVPHAQMYREMMATMGVASDAEAILPATQRLVSTMLSCCSDPRHLVGLGALCLGAEAIVPHVYSTILAGFAAVGEPAEHLEFFRIHVAGDDAHALTMRAIIDRELARDPGLRGDLLAGAARAIDARVEFFEALSEPQVVQKLEVNARAMRM